MKQRSGLLPSIGFALAIALAGCTSAKLDSYVSAVHSAGSVQRVAIMPITNQRINAGQAIELNRAFIQQIQRRNPQIQVVAGQNAIAVLNEKDLADAWSNFLVGYATSGLPNTRTLTRIAEALGVDAIVVGSIYNVKQEDSDGFRYPMTQVSLRYTMFSGKDGSVQWELTGEGKSQPYGYAAAPVFEVAKLAHEKVLEGLPF
jgi:hypothetical protein